MLGFGKKKVEIFHLPFDATRSDNSYKQKRVENNQPESFLKKCPNIPKNPFK